MAAIRFGIPINILSRHYRGNPKRPITWTDKTHNISHLCIAQCVGVSKSITTGHPTVLMHDEEKETVATCQAILLVWLDTGDGGSGSLRLLAINKEGLICSTKMRLGLGGPFFAKGGHS